MAGIRMTGLASGMDTQSLISQLSEAYQKKVDNAKKSQTKAEWKKAAWSDLNTKLTNFYKGALSTFKTTGTYKAKAVSGDLSGVKIVAGNNAVNGNHKVKVTGTASAQMWTGKQINKNTVTSTSYREVSTPDAQTTSLTSLTDSQGNSLINSLNNAKFEVTNSNINGGEAQTIDIGDLSGLQDRTVQGLTDYVNEKFEGTGIKVSYDNGKLLFTNENQTESSVKAINSGAEAFGVSTEGFTIGGPDSEGLSVSKQGGSFAFTTTKEEGASIKGSTKVSDLMGANWNGSASIKINDKEIAIDKNMTLSQLAKEMASKGINASFDEGQGRFYLSSTNTGSDNAFTVASDDANLISSLGLNLEDGDPAKIAATNATIEYNGVEYSSNTNNFNINGLSFDVTAKGEEMQFTVSNDVDGVYNKVKDFLKEYNSLLKEMTTLYNAPSSRGYDPLTSEEKDALTEDEVKDWEKKIKDSLLRRDDRLSSYTSNFRSIMNKSVEVDGKRYSLSSFGINTGEWSEKGLLHLDGDADDPTTSGNADKLKAAIAANPEAVTKTLAGLGNELFDYLMKAQRKTTTSSSQTFYDDVTLDADIKAQKENVKKQQEKMNDEEDKYYKQFSAMESAMAKLQSQQSYLSGLFGSM